MVAIVLASAACADFGGDYGYQGVQRVASGPFQVRSVFWLSTEPIVLASRHDPDTPPQMHMIRLVGGRSCKAGPLSSYVAAVDDRGFRLALTDQDGNLRFYDENCKNTEPVVPDSAHLRVYIDRGHYQYLVQQASGTLLVVNPFTGTQGKVATNVADFVPSSISTASDQPFALWIWTNSGELSLRTMDGTRLGPSLKNVMGFSVRGGLVLDRDSVEALITEDSEGVHLYALADDSSTPMPSEVISEPDACAARILGIRSTACTDPSCTAVVDNDVDSLAALPWLAMEAPCGSGDLALVAIDGSQRYQVPAAASDYSVFPGIPGGRPTLFFNASIAGEKTQTYYVEIRGGDQELLSPQSSGERFDLGSLGLSPARNRYTVVTGESHPRYGLWTPVDGFTPLLTDVADVYGSLLLHDFDGTTGKLANCDEGQCDDIAKGVPQGGFLRYTTFPRVGQGISVVAYLRDYDVDTETGALTVYAPSLDLSRTVDKHVSGFVNVESGPVRGIVYSVDEGKAGRRGLWFAPR